MTVTPTLTRQLPITKALKLFRGVEFRQTIDVTEWFSATTNVTVTAAAKMYMSDVNADIQFVASITAPDSAGKQFIVLTASASSTKNLATGYYFFDIHVTDPTHAVNQPGTWLVCSGLLHVSNTITGAAP